MHDLYVCRKCTRGNKASHVNMLSLISGTWLFSYVLYCLLIHIHICIYSYLIIQIPQPTLPNVLATSKLTLPQLVSSQTCGFHARQIHQKKPELIILPLFSSIQDLLLLQYYKTGSRGKKNIHATWISQPNSIMLYRKLRHDNG